ncbi:hypothetical protein NM208_g2560 [Fusarium decemcellulare]|uniref:Uncharacterized protein n=1 Tax=Fusarium decemcellulare TaxID=57161 RepID=A0ACC1SSB0_9HYPO|nr:hypothetical protein NM208_g2560 [Fusarium decemcellulare]
MNLLRKEESPFLTDVAQYAGNHRGIQEGLMCWEIKDPSQEPFNNILEAVCQKVSQCRSLSRSKLLLIDIFLRGRTLETSAVYVMLAASTERQRKTAVKHLRRSSLLKEYPGLKIDHWDWPPHAPNVTMTGGKGKAPDTDLVYGCPSSTENDFELSRLNPPSISSGNFRIFSLEHDYALIEVPHGQTFNSALRYMSPQNTLSIGLGQVPILVATPSLGIVPGFLDGRPTLMRLPYANKFSRLYPINLSCPVSNGDCGSAVINQNTHQIYGFIVAASVEGRVAYISSADEIHNDIASRLNPGCSESLPTSPEVILNPPCNTLYVGNLPIDTREEELKALFTSQQGYKRLCFRTKLNGPMCFVEFEHVSFATQALHQMDGVNSASNQHHTTLFQPLEAGRRPPRSKAYHLNHARSSIQSFDAQFSSSRSSTQLAQSGQETRPGLDPPLTEIEPYASEICSIYSQGPNALRIPRQLLSQSATLAAKVDSTGGISTVHIHDITYDAGHVIVHFLATGTYQCLKPQGATAGKKYLSEFITAIRVYVASGALHLPSLRTLARGEIARVGDRLSLPAVIETMEVLGPSFGRLPGIIGYVESRIMSSIVKAPPATAKKLLSELVAPTTMSNLLLKSMVLLKLSQPLQRIRPLEKGEIALDAERQFEKNTHGLSTGDGLEGSQLSGPSVAGLVTVTELAMKEAEERADKKAHAEAILAQADVIQKARADLEAHEKSTALEEDELERLQSKKIKRGGRLLKKDQTRLQVLLDNVTARDEAQAALEAKEQAFKEASDLAKAAAIKEEEEEEDAGNNPESEEADLTRMEAELAALIASRYRSGGSIQKDRTLLSLLQEKASSRAEAQGGRETKHKAVCRPDADDHGLAGSPIIFKGNSPPSILDNDSGSGCRASFSPFATHGEHSSSSETNGLMTPESTQDSPSFVP